MRDSTVQLWESVLMGTKPLSHMALMTKHFFFTMYICSANKYSITDQLGFSHLNSIAYDTSFGFGVAVPEE